MCMTLWGPHHGRTGGCGVAEGYTFQLSRSRLPPSTMRAVGDPSGVCAQLALTSSCLLTWCSASLLSLTLTLGLKLCCTSNLKIRPQVNAIASRDREIQTDSSLTAASGTHCRLGLIAPVKSQPKPHRFSSEMAMPQEVHECTAVLQMLGTVGN